MVLGILILHESSTSFKVIGTLLTILSGLIITKKLAKPKDIRGVAYAFIATLCYALVILIYKNLFAAFSSQSLTFLIFFIPSVMILFVAKNPVKRILKLAKDQPIAVFSSCAFGGLANLALNHALSIGEASKVLVIVESFLVITLIGEHILLKERDHLGLKVLSVALAVAGAILIRLS